MSLGLKAMDEQIICQCFAARAGEEVKSGVGIILEQKKEVPEVPISGTIVSVGENCPEWVHALVGREIALPIGQAAGVMVNVPDPDMVFGRIPRTSKKHRIFVAINHKAIRAVYDEVMVAPVEQPAASDNIKSSLSSLKGF